MRKSYGPIAGNQIILNTRNQLRTQSLSLWGETLSQKCTALHDMTARSSESWRILRSHLSNVAGTGTCSAMRAAKKWWAKCGGGVPSCPSLFKGGFGFWQNPGSHMVPTFIHHLLDVSDVFRCIHMMKDLMITLYSDNLADTAIIYHHFINHYLVGGLEHFHTLGIIIPTD